MPNVLFSMHSSPTLLHVVFDSTQSDDSATPTQSIALAFFFFKKKQMHSGLLEIDQPYTESWQLKIDEYEPPGNRQ